MTKRPGRPGRPERIRFMPDHSVTLPLWGAQGLVPEDWPPISPGLRKRLIAWQSRWEELQAAPTYQRSAYAEMDQLLEEGDPLLKEIQLELGPEYEVVRRF